MASNFTKQQKKYSNNIYVSPMPRQKLEEIVTEIGYKQGKVMAASAFVRYLIEHYGKQAKDEILNNG